MNLCSDPDLRAFIRCGSRGTMRAVGPSPDRGCYIAAWREYGRVAALVSYEVEVHRLATELDRLKRFQPKVI